MNANELADELYELVEAAAIILRQLQSENEAVKAHLNAWQIAYNPKKHGASNEK